MHYDEENWLWIISETKNCQHLIWSKCLCTIMKEMFRRYYEANIYAPLWNKRLCTIMKQISMHHYEANVYALLWSKCLSAILKQIFMRYLKQMSIHYSETKVYALFWNTNQCTILKQISMHYSETNIVSTYLKQILILHYSETKLPIHYSETKMFYAPMQYSETSPWDPKSLFTLLKKRIAYSLSVTRIRYIDD